MKKCQKHSEETKRKMSLVKVGRKRVPFSLQHKERMSLAKLGERHWNWKGGDKRPKNGLEHKKWRKAVFERDNYICQDCGQKGGDLEAHHIKPYAFYPELRFELSNGKTLCIDCHKKTDTFGRPILSTFASKRETFII